MDPTISGALASNANPLPAETDPSNQRVKEDALANKEAFLQMLIAQIQNQDPLNPTDGVQFLSQLAQFSELEQIIGVREDIQSVRGVLVNPPNPAPAATETSS